MKGVKLVRLRFYTKCEDDLVLYKLKGAKTLVPEVYVYEHFGTQEEALAAFMPLDSFAMAKTADSFIAFPLKGADNVHNFSQLLFRVERGKVSELDSPCKLCKFKVRKVLSGCRPCEGLRGITQLNPFVVKEMKSNVEYRDHYEDRRAGRNRGLMAARSALLQ